MFCPKCSQPQTSERVRFCSRCGFPLDAVKELVGREDEAPAEGRPRDLLPPQKEIATGAALMYVGAFVASYFGLVSDIGLAALTRVPAVVVLGFTLAFITLLFRPLTRSLGRLFSEEGGDRPAAPTGRLDGLNLGATLMFVGSLKALLIASDLAPGTRESWFLLLLTAFLLIVLALRPLLRAAHKLLSGGAREARSPEDATPADEPSSLAGAAHAANALPPAQSIPASAFRAPRAKAAEPAKPPSITEDTTRDLRDA